MATHPLVVGGDHPPDDVNYGGDDTGPERYFIDRTYHFQHLERTSFAANRRTRSSQSMSSISIDSSILDSVDEVAWSESTRKFVQEANQNRLRTIGEQRPASLSSVDYDQLNGLSNVSENGYISFAPALGSTFTTASTSRPYSPHLRHGYPSTDSLMYSHSDRSGASTPLTSTNTTPVFDTATNIINLDNSLLTPPILKKTNRIPPRWRAETRIAKPEYADKNDYMLKKAIAASSIPNVVSLDSDEEDDIDIKDKNISRPPWDSSNAKHHRANDVFRSSSSSTRSEDNPLLTLLTDHLMDISCTILDAMSCSRSFDSGDEEHNNVVTPSLVTI